MMLAKVTAGNFSTLHMKIRWWIVILLKRRRINTQVTCKIVFDSEEEKAETIEMRCPMFALPMSDDIVDCPIPNISCEECWKRYVEMEVNDDNNI
jgi:hypothetical protein